MRYGQMLTSSRRPKNFNVDLRGVLGDRASKPLLLRLCIGVGTGLSLPCAKTPGLIRLLRHSRREANWSEESERSIYFQTRQLQRIS